MSDKTGGMALWGNHASHCTASWGETESHCNLGISPSLYWITNPHFAQGYPLNPCLFGYITYITNKQSPSLLAIIVVFISHCRVQIQVCYIFDGETCRCFAAESPKKPSQPSHTVNGRSPATGAGWIVHPQQSL